MAEERWRQIGQHFMWKEIYRQVHEAFNANRLAAHPTHDLIRRAVAVALQEAADLPALNNDPIRCAEWQIARALHLLIEHYGPQAQMVGVYEDIHAAHQAAAEAQAHVEALAGPPVDNRVLWEAKPAGEGCLGYLDRWVWVQHPIKTGRAGTLDTGQTIGETVNPEAPRCVTKLPAFICDCGRFMLVRQEEN